MAREFFMERFYGKTDKNVLYVADFEHIAGNFVQVPYSLWEGRKGKYGKEERNVLASSIKKFRRNMRQLLMDAREDNDVSPEIFKPMEDFYREANKPKAWATGKCIKLYGKLRKTEALLKEKIGQIQNP
jgi:hypothetical protein